MKQRKVVSMIGALGVILGAVAFITGCPQANSNKDKKDNTTVNNGGNTGNNSGNTGNNGDIAVQPTSKADPTLKGTNWSGDGKSIYFSKDGNIASIRDEEMLYTIQGEKISFDLSSFITIAENMTEEKFIRKIKIEIKQDIAELEKEIREAEKNNGDEQIKTQLEAKLEEMKELLQSLENPDEQMKERIKERIKESLEGIHEYAGKMKANAKFDGIFNSEKTRLTIEKFPNYDWSTKEVTIKKIVFEKE